MTTPILELTEVCVERGDNTVLNRVSLRVDAGEVVVLRGPNGSGKTTLLRVAAGLTAPIEGTVRYRGSDDAVTAQREMLWCGHKSGLKDELTARENVAWFQQLRQAAARDVDAALTRVQVQDCADRPVATLSAGQRRRTALARLLVADANLWLLDEPFTNLDDLSSSIVHECINTHVSQGGACVMAAHQLAVDAHSHYRAMDIGAAND
ncbi:MAG: heme ABC exporter ATP-binding protein CcmA [Pseudomonadota bacterium]